MAIILFGLLYLAVIVLVIQAIPTNDDGWALTAAILGLLLIEKILELRLGATAQSLLHTQGWEHHKRTVQASIILGACAIGLIGFVAAFFLTRSNARIALMATMLLGAFAFTRGTQLNWINKILGAGFGPFRVRHVAEIGLLGLIALAAYRGRRPAPRR